jgi:hypothetical protein
VADVPSELGLAPLQEIERKRRMRWLGYAACMILVGKLEKERVE